MSHPRFYVPPNAWSREEMPLDEAESHHATDVLRLEPGDRVVAFNGEGVEASCEIAAVTRHRLVLRPGAESRGARLPCQITLAQAVPKGKNMDLIVQKATELGVASIVPLLSDRTVIRLSAAEASQKEEKWRETAIEACKQCGQNWLPRIEPPVTAKEFFVQPAKYDLMLVASLQPDARHLKQWLAEAASGRAIRTALVLVGPEGDFTPAELGMARSAGCLPVTLGPIILRTETAAIYVLSILSHELQTA